MELSRSTAKAKRACADKGYVADPFASLLCEGDAAGDPLLHRGYYARHRAVDAALSRREFELVFAHASGRSACARLVRAARAWNAFGGWVALRALLERSRSGAPRTLVEVVCGHRPFKTVLSYLSLPRDATGIGTRNDARLWKCPPPLLARLQARPTPDGGSECIDLRSWDS